MATLPTVNDLQLVEPVLTNMLIAYMQSDTRFVASRVFPVVRVDKDSGTYGIFTKKYWFVDGLKYRAPGSAFLRSGFGISSATYTTIQWGLEHLIPDENRANNQLPVNLDRSGLQWLAQQSNIRKERGFAADFMTTGVWGTDDNNSTTDWDDYTAGDPVTDIRTARRTINTNTGQRANTAVMGEIVWDGVMNHPDIIDRLKYDQAATEENMAQALGALVGLGTVLKADGVYNSANTGASASMAAIIDDDCLVCYVDPSAGVEGATAGKTFAWPGGGAEGSVVSYREQQTKSDVLQHSEQWDQVATATDVGYFFADVV